MNNVCLQLSKISLIHPMMNISEYSISSIYGIILRSKKRQGYAQFHWLCIMEFDLQLVQRIYHHRLPWYLGFVQGDVFFEHVIHHYLEHIFGTCFLHIILPPVKIHMSPEK